MQVNYDRPKRAWIQRNAEDGFDDVPGRRRMRTHVCMCVFYSTYIHLYC